MSMPVKSEFLELTDTGDSPVYIAKDLVSAIGVSGIPQNPGTVIFLRNGQTFLVKESPAGVFENLVTASALN